MNRYLTSLLFISLFFMVGSAFGQNIVQQWKQGLSGSKLTTYNGSVISSNSTLTVLNFCSNGRYSYYREGSWSVPGQAGGASQNTITGSWDVVMYQGGVYLSYQTDQGQQGYFPMYLQNNGKVNIGGAAYSVQQRAARCY